MSPSPAPGPTLTRRSLLAGSAAGLALLVAGCTSSSGTRHDDAATSRQAAALAAQVPVQQAVVAAYAAAEAADAALGSKTADLASQAAQQLARLKAAAPASTPSRSKGAPTSGATAVPAGQDAQAWLSGQVSAAADSHTTACLAQTGARAALLGSIAAGLRGQAAVLS
jgi:hypothetical protein